MRKIPKEICLLWEGDKPEHDMRNVPSPTLDPILSAYEAARAAGLRQVKLGNPGVFAESEQD